MTILDKIRQKSQQIFNADLNKRVAGNQSISGGIQHLGNSFKNLFTRDLNRRKPGDQSIGGLLNNIRQEPQEWTPWTASRLPNNRPRELSSNYWKPTPEVRTRDYLRELYNNTLSLIDVPKGIVGGLKGGNPNIGFLGFGQATDPNKPLSISNPAPRYEPKTFGEKLGSFGLNLGTSYAVGENTGVNQSIRQGANTLTSIPQVQRAVSNIGDFTTNKLMRFRQKIKPYNITFKDLRAVENGTATPEQVIKVRKMEYLMKELDLSTRDMLSASKEQSVHGNVNDFIDDLMGRSNVIDDVKPIDKILSGADDIPKQIGIGSQPIDDILTSAVESKPQTLYHGTSVKFDKFDNSKIQSQSGMADKGFSFSTNKKVAGLYANVERKIKGTPRIIEADVDTSKFPVYDAKGKSWEEATWWTGYKNAGVHQIQDHHFNGANFNDSKTGGKIDFPKTEGVVFKNINETGEGSQYIGDTVIVFDSKNINIKPQETGVKPLGDVLQTTSKADQIREIGKQITKTKSLIKIETNPRAVAELKDRLSLLKETYGALKDQAKLPKAGINPLTAESSPDIKAQVEKNQIDYGAEAYKETSVSKRLVDRNIRSLYNRLESGGKAGKAASDLHYRAGMEAGLEKGSYQERMKIVTDTLSKQEKADFGDYVTGKKEVTSTNLQKVVDEWKSVADEIQAKSTGAGLDTGYLENYYPGIPKGKDVVGELTSKGVDPKEAQNRYNNFMQRNKERKFGSLDYSRDFPEIEYRTDIGVMDRYIRGSTKRYTEAKLFGVKDEVIYSLANQTKDPAASKEYLDQLIGKGDYAGAQKGADLSRKIRDVQTITKLTYITSLKNLTQNVSIISATDLPSYAKSLKEMLSDPTKVYSYGRSLGEIETEMVTVFGEEYRNSSIGGKYIKLIGMRGTEEFNRVMASNTGRIYIEKMFKKAHAGDQAAIRELKRKGVDFNKDSTDEAVKKVTDYAAKDVSRKTQFSAPEGNIPATWSSPTGKVVTQFKSFSYQHSTFLKGEWDRVWEEFKHGNFKPLINDLVAFGVITPIIGEVVADLSAILRNKKRKDMTFIQRYVDNIKYGSTIGIFEDLFNVFKYGEAGTIGIFGGVTASDFYKAAKAGVDFSKGVKDYDPEESFLDNVDPSKTTRRFAVGNIPIVGKLLSNTAIDNAAVDNLFGGKNEGLAKDDKETYNLLRDSGNDDKAELFKKENQWLDTKDDDKTTLLEVILGKKEKTIDTLSEDATPAQKKEYRTKVNKILDNGGVPSEEQIKTAIFKDKDPNSKSIEERMDVYKAIKSVSDNENYSEEQKEAIIKASGASDDNVEYYMLTTKDQDVRLQELLPYFDRMSDKEIITELAKGRRKVGGQELISSGMLTYLYERDYISKADMKMLQALKFDEVNNEFYLTKSYKGAAGAASAKAKLKAFKAQIANARSLIRALSGISSFSGRATSQMDNSGDKLLTDILSGKPARRTPKSGGLWF